MANVTGRRIEDRNPVRVDDDSSKQQGHQANVLKSVRDLQMTDSNVRANNNGEELEMADIGHNFRLPRLSRDTFMGYTGWNFQQTGVTNDRSSTVRRRYDADLPKQQGHQANVWKSVRDLEMDDSNVRAINIVAALEMVDINQDFSLPRPRLIGATNMGYTNWEFPQTGVTNNASATARRRYGAALDENRVERADLRQRKERKLDFPHIPILYPILAYAYRVWPTFSTTKKLLIILIVLAFIGLILFVSLFPASFVYVEYHEYGFVENRITEQVFYDDLYQAGCYFLSPIYEMVRFKATAHFVDKTFIIMNKEGMDLKLHIMLQYFLKLSQVEQLYRKYHFKYEEVIESLVESTTKNTAVKISIDEYRLERMKVEAELLRKIRYVLSGDCCEPCCPSSCGISVNCTTCLPEGQCKLGHHVELRYFQMGEVSIPDEIMNRFLRQVILREDAEKALYLQTKAIEVKLTEIEVGRIKNAAEEVIQKAKAKDRVITVKAEAERDRDVQRAYQTALTGMFSRLNITSEEKKCSLMFVRALEDMKDKFFTYDYDIYWRPKETIHPVLNRIQIRQNEKL